MWEVEVVGRQRKNVLGYVGVTITFSKAGRAKNNLKYVTHLR